MAPSFPRERLSADLATHVMRKLDLLARREGYNRTTMLTLLINEAYDRLPVPTLDDAPLKELNGVMKALEG